MEKKQAPLASLHDRLTRFMEEKAMRKTPERYEILRVAGIADGIFTIDELMGFMLKHASFQVSRATLFNTMELFVEAGLAIKHSLATAAHYEMRTDSNPKAYVICRQCNTITKVSTSTAKLALINLHVRYFAIEEKLLYMHGVCRNCQAKNRQEARKQKKLKLDKNKNGKR
ncbi:MAG: transcriptional repressor [Bacteroidaceae bacterium]|nr:transcriptional repressor [Bacteroidaceae bacterium]